MLAALGVLGLAGVLLGVLVWGVGVWVLAWLLTRERVTPAGIARALGGLLAAAAVYVLMVTALGRALRGVPGGPSG